jgi:hypothetical protein
LRKNFRTASEALSSPSSSVSFTCCISYAWLFGIFHPDTGQYPDDLPALTLHLKCWRFATRLHSGAEAACRDEREAG